MRDWSAAEEVVVCYMQSLMVIIPLALLVTLEVHVCHVVTALLPAVWLASAILGLLATRPGAFLRRLLALLIASSPASALVLATADGFQLGVDAAHVCEVLLERLLSSLVLLLESRNVILVLFDVDLGDFGRLVLPEELLHLFELLLNHE